MSVPRRWLLILTALLAALPRFAAATSAENGMFNSATGKLRTELYEQAERDFAQFIQQFPESPRLPEAILAQAEARFKQTNYNGALELLTARQGQAGKWTDEFLFWIGECYSHKGEQTKAAETFARLTKDYPRSSRLLEAIVKEAAARSKLEPPDWPQVIQTLQQTNGLFQAVASTNASSDWVARGYILLGEAYLAQTNYHAAEAVLTPLGNRSMSPSLGWQWQYILCRAQLGDGRAEAALLSTSNLLMWAKSAEQPGLVAQSVSFKARALEQAGRFDQALDAYKENLVPGSPAQYQQRALLKITEISVAQNKIPDAAQTLERFLGAYTNAAAADLGWLTLGELRLRQFANSLSSDTPAVNPTNTPPPTNYLQQARQAFETLTTRFPKSPRAGLGYLDLGWCQFLEGKLPESQKAFQAGVEHLPLSPDLARAYFKLADAQFRQRDFAAAALNYSAVVEKFKSFPEVQTNLFEPALYQTVQASLAAGNLSAATNAVQQILEWYPNGFHTDRAVLLTGQEISRTSDPARARAVLSDFAAKATNSLLLPEVKLAIVRTYEQQSDWTNAIQQYDLWLASFTNDPARPRAEFCRALDYSHAGNETNAWASFTNFVAIYPTNELTPQAQWWLADFNFRAGDYNGAENDFQLLFHKWPSSDLACEAWMMAGRAAVARQSWENARDYFTKLYEQTNCPTEVRSKALFAYGDYWISRESTNKPADYLRAVEIFGTVSQENPTKEIGLLALGRKGNALLLSGQLDEAVKAYQQLTNASAADFTIRAKAILGLADVLEKQAEQKTSTNRTELLKQALDRCLDVLFPEKILRNGEKADPFQTKEAGMKAIHLAEVMEDWPHVITISKELCRLMPVLCPSLEKKTAKAQDNLRAKS